MVRRYASHTERLAIPRVLVSSRQELPGDGRVGTVDPDIANFGSIDLPARQPGSASNDGGCTALRLAVPSSVFRNASCAMRSSGARATTHDGGNLPEPANLVAL